jgi:hypothetical protein
MLLVCQCAKQSFGFNVRRYEGLRAVEISPSARNVARLTLASRNLANNLQDAGIEVSPERLVALVEGATAPFEDQQVDDYVRSRYGSR